MIDKLKLYVVTDSNILAERDFYESIEASLKGGATMLQLREKECGGKEFLDRARRLKEMTKNYDVPLIINDRVDIALLCDADGVHVGQSDIGAEEVRKLIGPNKLLGVSARSVEEAVLAEKQGADYIGVGAMFGTNTKLDAEYVSLETLFAIEKAVNIPIVLIGGLTLNNIETFNENRVAGYAIVSAILGAEDIEAETIKWKVKLG